MYRVTSGSGVGLAYLRDERLAPLAVSALPAWLWRLDATRILWANPTGAAIFGAATPAAVGKRVFDGGQPVAAQIIELAARLPDDGSPRIEHLRDFGAGAGLALACECSRVLLDDRTAAILIVATEGAGPDLPLDERAARLLADCDEPVAIFSIEGKLIHATPAADPYLLGAGWLAALGAAAAATDALSTGHAQERSVHGSITIDRIGRESTTVLLATFGPPDESDKMASPAVADVPAIEPVSAEPAMPEQTDIERTDILQAEPPAVPAPASPPAPPEPMAREPIALTPTPVAPPLPAERRHPLRFVWQIDDDGCFTLGSEEFIALAGPSTVTALGRTWPEIAGELGLDPERRVEGALASHDTWSGLTVTWPVDGSDERLTVELSGLPAFDRERVFRGYRGFGVCRDVARLNRLAQMRSGIEPAPVAVAPVENVVRFPAAEAGTTVEPGTPALSTREHHAFYELSRRLTHQLNADGDETDRDILQSEQLVSPAGDMRQLFDRLPSGVLIYRLDQLIYANPAFLQATGHSRLDDLIEAGGLDSLLIAPDNGTVDAVPGKPFALTIDGSDKVRIEGELIPIHWEGEAAHALLTHSPARETVVAETAASDPAPARAEPLPAAAEDTVRKADLECAQAEVAELHAILDTATDGVVVLDRAGQILSANRSTQALFGYDAHELVGRSFFDLFAPESIDIAQAYLDGQRDGGVAGLLNSGREVIGRVRQGGLISLFMTVGRIGESADRLCAVFRDITPWKKVENDLRTAKQQAEKASAAKSDLLAKISHEIRTPLNAIIGFSEVMMEERFGPVGSERYRDYLKDIHASGGHLISLINDLLDLSKIEAGKLELSFAKVSVNDLTQQCVAIMQPQANRERIIIRTSLPPALPQVLADARSVRQIMLNLLSNSIKFTGAGGQVIVSTALNDNGDVVLRVRDNGIGMSESDIVTALEPFRQLATTTLGRAAGTGLGLPLTKALAEANRASFRIKSAPKEGTLVEVAFPAAHVLAG